YYDSAERSLYARALKGELYGMHPLTSLPRFGVYDEGHDPGRLDRKDLRGIDRFAPPPGGLPVDPSGESSGDLASWLGVSKPVTLDIVGFYSYADVVEEILDDP